MDRSRKIAFCAIAAAGLATACSNSSSSNGGGFAAPAAAPRYAVYLADQNVNGTNELYASLINDTPQPGTRINGALGVNQDVSQARFSPNGKFVAYRADETSDNIFELYLVNLSGNTPVASVKINGALVTNGNVSSDFKWLSNSSGLVYRADQDLDGQQELYFVAVGGAAPAAAVKLNTALPITASVSEFGIAANGAFVIARADIDNNGDLELYSISLASSPATPARLSAGVVANGDISSFSIAPNSMSVAFAGDKDTDTVVELYLVDLSGSNPGAPQKVNGTLVLNGDVTNSITTGYGFAPDSSAIIYRADQVTDTRIEFFLAKIAGGTATPPAVAISGSVPVGAIAQAFRFSPTEQKVVISGDLVLDNNFELFLVDFSGAAPTAPVRVNGTFVAGQDISPTSGNSAFQFTADGKKVVYVSDENNVNNINELFAVEVGTLGTSVRVSQALITGGNVSSFGMSGNTAIFLADADIDQEFELFLSDLTTGTPTPKQVNGPLVTGGSASEFSVSRDGKRLLYRAVQDSLGVTEAYVSAIDDPTPSAKVTKVSGTMILNGDAISAQFSEFPTRTITVP